MAFGDFAEGVCDFLFELGGRGGVEAPELVFLFVGCDAVGAFGVLGCGEGVFFYAGDVGVVFDEAGGAGVCDLGVGEGG